MHKYGLHNKLNAIEGKGLELSKILLEAADLLANAEGCQLYLISKSEHDPDEIWVSEVWSNQDSHQQSLQSPAIRALIDRAMPLLKRSPEKGQVLTVIGGLGVE